MYIHIGGMHVRAMAENSRRGSYNCMHVRAMAENESQAVEIVKPIDNNKPELKPYRLERIPKWVREVNQGAYTPRYVSIGPLHRGSDDLRQQVVKNDYVRRLIEDPPEELTKIGLKPKKIEHCRNALKDDKWLVEKARSFYAEKFENTIKEDDWANMLLWDGCFVIMHLIEFSLNIKSRHTKWVSAVIEIDLILLENQLPFFILEHIMYFVFNDWSEDEVKSMLKKLVLCCWGFRLKDEDGSELEKFLEDDKFQNIHHLLHLIHQAHYKSIYHISNNRTGGFNPYIQKTYNFIRFTPVLVMKMIFLPCQLCKQLVEKMEKKKGEEEEEEEMNIPSATVVHNLDIHFRKKSTSGLESKYAVCMNATANNTVDFPQLTVSSSEGPLLHNLIAWEHAFDDDYVTKGHFTKFAFLMYNLINSGDDIALLQRNGILLNKFGTDEEVISYFKDLVLYSQREDAKTTSSGSKTLSEKVKHLLGGMCKSSGETGINKKSNTSGERGIDEIVDVVKRRLKKPEYQYWAEVKMYFRSPVQLVLVVTSVLLFVSTLVPAILSVHMTK